MSERKLVEVVAGILYQENGTFLLSSRPEGKPYAGYWEFAGGKVESDETLLTALQREFEEELGIQIHGATPWLTRIHDYEHARVRLHFFRIGAHQWSGTLRAREHQQWCWQTAGNITVTPLLPANQSILAALAIPDYFQGSLSNGFISQTASRSAFQLLPFERRHEPHQALYLPSQDVHSVHAETDQLWVIGPVDASHDIPHVQAIIWPLYRAEDAVALKHLLALGSHLPILILTDSTTIRNNSAWWYTQGIHGFIADDGLPASHITQTTLAS